MSSAGRSVLSPLPGCRQTDTAATFCSPFYNRFVRNRCGRVSVQQLSNLNTSNRYCSSALSEFSSSSFSVSTQEPRPTQMSVARQLRNIAACNGQTGENVCTVSHLVIFTVLDQRQHQTIDLVQNLLKTNPQLLEIKVRYPRSSLHFYR